MTSESPPLPLSPSIDFKNFDYSIQSWEQQWVDLYPFLVRRGYRLRPRYAPDWQPSWLRAEGIRPSDCEDSMIGVEKETLMDAVRLSDNQKVVFKKVSTSSNEIPVTTLLSSDEHRKDPRNCAVPILDVIMIPSDDTHALLVMPQLLQFENLPFQRLGEFCEAAIQFLQGLEYLYEHNIVHRDVCWGNLMMDASKTIPKGFHFLRWDSHNGRDYLNFSWKSRWSVRPNKYYIIDFGLSAQAPSKDCGALGIWGQDRTVPEMSRTVPYNPFKADVYQLGNVLKQCTLEYEGLEAFLPLAERMTLNDPDARPTASEAAKWCEEIVAKIKKSRKQRKRIWRSPAHLTGGESPGERFLIVWCGLKCLY